MEVDDDFYIDEPDPFYVDDPLNGGESSDSTQEQPLFVKKGDMINSQCRQLIANVAAFMKKEAELYKTTMQIIIPIINHKERVLAATGISSGVYCTIMNEAEAEEVASDVLEPTPRHGLKRKHEDSTEVLDKHGDDAVENVPDFQIKEEITPESTLADELIIKTSHSELSLIKEEINLDGAEGEKCPTPETVYIPGFYIEDPERTNEAAKNATLDLLPAKSKEKYDSQYNKFSQWCSERNVEHLTEDVLLEYFSEQSKTVKVSTMWAHYSMLKATIATRQNIKIGEFTKLTAYLKTKNHGYQAMKSRTFTREQINRFLSEAPDECYLMMKVVLIITVAGACRRDELQRLTLDDIQDVGSVLIVNIPDSKTKVKRTFTVGGNVQSLEIFRKYISLRPADCDNRHLFLSYYSGKCKKQHVGINTFGRIPNLIATYLKLPKPKEYTAHCLKRTSAALIQENKLELARRRRQAFETDVTFSISTPSEMCATPSTSRDSIQANHDGWGICGENSEVTKEGDDTRMTEESAKNTTFDMLPAKSKEQYETQYNKFSQWCSETKVENLTENVLLEYFSEQSKTFKSSTLWAHYSMLKATIAMKRNININQFPKLTEYLKRISQGYQAKKSKTFTRAQVNAFLSEAPDECYLLMKVVLIIGLAGACRRDELQRMSLDDVQDVGSILIINIPDSRTKVKRTFTISNGNVQSLEIYRKYRSLRPASCNNKHLFLSYYSGKCKKQHVGVNTFGKIPSLIATYLKLPNPKAYTAHCLKRTSAALLVENKLELARRRRRGFEPDETVPVSTTSETCPVPSTSQNNIRTNGDGCDINDQNLEPMKQEDDSRTAEENSDDSGDEECLSTPPEILNNLDKATATISNLLPVNSQELYEKEYEIFTEWKKKNKVGAVSESVIFNYFFEKSKVLKPSSLWSKFSMLRLTMELKDSVNIAKFPKLMTFLKRYSAGYKPKKSKTLTKEEIIRFLTEAPDEIYLLMKTALILGIFGACRRVELTNMNIDNIQDRGSVLIVHIPDIKARTERTFTVGGKIGELDPIEIYRKYVALRPKHTTHRRLFVNYRGGKCTVQVVGINTFAKIPSLIAKYLEIPDYASYTGHCLRRTSASLLSDSGVMVAGNFNPLR